MIITLIVGYNSKKYLSDCFQSLFAANPDCQIVFVDNASTDGSADYIKKHYPTIHLIEEETNLGFAQANNVGIAAAKKLGATKIFFLNPDTTVDKDCFSALVSSSDKEVLQPIILLANDKDKVNTTGGTLNYLGYSYCSDYKAEAETITARDNLILGSGAAIIIPMAILDKVGTFDGSFFMYHEDVDLLWRIKRAGYTIRLVPSAKVWHHYSFSRNPRKFYYAERNRLIFLLKNFSWRYLLFITPMLIINELAGCLYLALLGMPLVKLQGYGYILRHWFSIMKQRRQAQLYQTVPLSAVYDQIGTELSFSEVKLPAIALYNALIAGYWRLIKPLIG